MPFEENMRLNEGIVEGNRHKTVIEGACDEIVDTTCEKRSDLTTPEQAFKYLNQTQVDFIVANLGKEHR